jgi:hypothetical protein
MALHMTAPLSVNPERWLAASETGGVAEMPTIAKAPSKAPLLSSAMQQALRDRLTRPEGFPG